LVFIQFYDWWCTEPWTWTIWIIYLLNWPTSSIYRWTAYWVHNELPEDRSKFLGTAFIYYLFIYLYYLFILFIYIICLFYYLFILFIYLYYLFIYLFYYLFICFVYLVYYLFIYIIYLFILLFIYTIYFIYLFYYLFYYFILFIYLYGLSVHAVSSSNYRPIPSTFVIERYLASSHASSTLDLLDKCRVFASVWPVALHLLSWRPAVSRAITQPQKQQVLTFSLHKFWQIMI
jgi:hypothetical protein